MSGLVYAHFRLHHNHTERAAEHSTEYNEHVSHVSSHYWLLLFDYFSVFMLDEVIQQRIRACSCLP
jgi:hypothetical protein